MTRVVRISRCLLTFAARPFSPPTTCEHKSHTSTALATGGDGRTSKARTAAAAQRPPAAVVRVLSRLRGAPPGVCSGLGAGGGLSFADCWALCVELGLVREPHQSGRAARRRWGREKAVGDGGGPHSSIQNGPSPRPVCC